MDIEDVSKIRTMYKLKEVYRNAFVGKRHESSAEHTWSALVLADYLLTEHDFELDKGKVFELILYHDAVEIIAGDTPINDVEGRKVKEELEKKAIIELSNKIPKNMGKRVVSLFHEFEAKESREAKFAKMIDALDAIIHEMDYPEDWKGWTEKMVRGHYEKRFTEFVETKVLFEEIMDFLRTNGYFEIA